MRPSSLLAFSLIVALHSYSQSSVEAEATKKRLTIDAQTTTSVSYLSSLLMQASLWGGIEDYRADCSPVLEMRLPPLDGTVEEALAQLRSQDSSLKWKAQRDGILVSRGAPASAFLDTKIGDFTFYRHDPADKSTDTLLSLPTVQQQMKRLSATLRPPELGFAGAPIEAKPTDLVHVKNASIREALNAIAIADHPRVWLFQQSKCGGQDTLLVQWVVK